MLSLTQDCFCTALGCINSLSTFFTGFLGIFIGEKAVISWFANPFLIASIALFLKFPKLSFVTSIIAFLLSFAFLFFDSISVDEGGSKEIITELKSGYWLWFGSSLILLISNFIVLIFEGKYRRTLNPEEDYWRDDLFRRY
ncbi:MAG: hypothetical protein RO257_15375 [Candidatus Kapabacteria bacterium]|nr:hypothetical protein [Candidatus Kapabacteria bacterium]